MTQRMKTVPVQIVCRKCSNPYRTQVRGGNSRCPQCRTSRYVRQDQEWEGPVPEALEGVASRAEAAAARLPVWCSCGCGHEWQSRAEDHQRLRCPSCGNGVRVPIRTYNNTDGGTPTGHFPAPAPYRPPAPCRYVDPGPPEREEEEEWEEEPEEDRPTLAESLQGLMRMFNVPTLPTPARPAPVHQAPATRPAARPIAPPPACSAPTRPTTARPAPLPAPGPQRTPYEILREEQRRDSVCSLARSLGGPLYVWFDQPAGACEVLDVNLTPDRQRCRATPTHAVVIHGGLAQQTHAYACETHALHLAGHVDRFEGLEAACHLLRKRR